MSERTEWRFEFKVGALMDATTKLVDYHREHFEYWRRERDAKEQELREEGIEIKSHEVTGGRRLEATFNSSIERRYAEAVDKIDHHEGKLREYERWQRVFALEDNHRALSLDFNDIQFFDL